MYQQTPFAGEECSHPNTPYTSFPPFARQMAVLEAGAHLMLTVIVGRRVTGFVVWTMVYLVFVFVGVGYIEESIVRSDFHQAAVRCSCIQMGKLTAVIVTTGLVTPLYVVLVVVVVTLVVDSTVAVMVKVPLVVLETVEVENRAVFVSVRRTSSVSRPRLSRAWASARRALRSARSWVRSALRR